ncbi:ABC transporter substrate-binding protein [Anaerosacchariphilus polymeriproducens]|uniref:ABC transporter substrate-binding protein n=1 Tax=Anaerosacchariphilus polymeriproducens TaxID=1812858 RepID=A0A371AT32_9FIRM|nr:ABC transporter substrate-binding protein [Anaerosacchariphilus polymeriproducens]RDU22734.1 ABC transporter substrate-binding protein [Anaerosacchariphilus polymeriproducens]
MKKLASLLLVVTMSAMVFSGCGNNGSSSSKKDDSTFLIGGSGPLTGSAATYGLSVKQGAEVAVKEINDAGGVKVGDKAYKLDLDFQDDENKEDKAVTAYNTLMDNDINAFLGTVTSTPCLALTKNAYDDGILLVTPSASALDCTKYDNAFRICFTDPMQGEKLAEYAVKTLGKKKIGIIYHNDDDYSIGLEKAFTEKVKELGGEIVASEASASKDNDFSTQLTSIKSSKADLIFAPVYYQAAAYITKQASDAGMKIPFIGGDGWDGILGVVTEPATVEGAVFLTPFTATDSSVADFVKTYEAAYKETPNQFAADGYDGVYAIAEAMKQAGSIKNEDLIAAMTKITVDGLTGKMTFDKSGEANKDAKFVEIKDGKYLVK